MRICISSGHGLHVAGAIGPQPWGLVEVDEARRVVDAVTKLLADLDVEVVPYQDDVSTEQAENLERIVAFHNSQQRDFDVSVHFNAYEVTDEPRGCEVLYLTQAQLARDVSAAIASTGFIDRGGKKREGLYFLEQTTEPAILIEVCFTDSKADCELYRAKFGDLCMALAYELSGPPVTVAET